MYSAGKLVHYKENNKVAERTAMRFTTDLKIFCERKRRDNFSFIVERKVERKS